MSSLRINLLGGFEARGTSGAVVSLPTKKTQALLAYLALHAGHAHGRDALASLLWGDTDDAHARKSLHQAVDSLHKALPPARPPILVLEHDKVALNAAAIDVDVAERAVAASPGQPGFAGHALARTLYPYWLARSEAALTEGRLYPRQAGLAILLARLFREVTRCALRRSPKSRITCRSIWPMRGGRDGRYS